MKTMQTLKKKARQSAEWRGHTLGTFRKLDNNSAEASCVVCGKSVQVNTRPQANQIDIGGNAVALNCDSYARR